MKMLRGVEYSLNLKGMSTAQEKSTWVDFIPGLLKLGKSTLIFGQAVLTHEPLGSQGTKSPQLWAQCQCNSPRSFLGFSPLTAPLGARPAPSPASHFRTSPQTPFRPFGLPAHRTQDLTVPRYPFTPTFSKRKTENHSDSWGARGCKRPWSRACAEAAAGCRPGRSGDRAARARSRFAQTPGGETTPACRPTAKRLADRAGRARSGAAGGCGLRPEAGAEPGAGPKGRRGRCVPGSGR